MCILRSIPCTRPKSSYCFVKQSFKKYVLLGSVVVNGLVVSITALWLNFTNSAQGVTFQKLVRCVIDESFEKSFKTV